MQQQKAALDELIELNHQQIEATQAALYAKEQQVADKRAVIYENEQLFQQRLVAIYKMNNSSSLSTLLTVDSFSDLSDVLNALRLVSVHDTDLLNLLAQEKQGLETEQAEIDLLLQDLQDSYNELAENAQILADNIAATEGRITAAEAKIQAESEAYAFTLDELEKAQNEMATIGKGIGGSTSSDGSQYVGGVFTWPVPGYYSISCYFGSPDPNGSPHRGMDIVAPAGAIINACGKGTVIQASYAHYSYGNYVVVDHGAGVKTLYAHCTGLLTSTGAEVNAGDPIATVGSTGFSTGAHLHLEVQKDGALQNPLNYLSA